MHSRVLFTLCAAFVVASTAACSGNDGKISVEPADGTLTDQGNDALFTVKLDESGQSDGYALDGLKVKATPDGKSAIDVVCTTNDANGDGKLGKDETLSCKEGASNDFGKDLSGKEVKVELYAKIDGDDQRVGDATWTPK